ncbi:hypothetical protein [Thalassotalea sp. ND16A]|uniref:hypothetical protein n=1 Tax=Thalassotalea sp. ND16A TaxID=1535422 RepID=UPI00051A734C|nr:hypothetical protein [Thalassotalea sp. ND16A]KGJ99636.1 hypothetical protein ND16A_3736 [Thalassotalea sp. ND16A]
MQSLFHSIIFKLILSLALVSVSHASIAKWQIYHQQQQLSIRYQSNKETGLYEVKARVVISASIEDFYQLLTNENLAPTWLDKVSSTEPLMILADHSVVVMTKFDGFAFVSAREMLTRTSIETKTATSLALFVTDYNDYLPLNDGYVRVKDVNVRWQATLMANNQLQVSYHGSFDPAGSLPKWLSNRYSLSSIKATMHNLQKLRPVK